MIKDNSSAYFLMFSTLCCSLLNSSSITWSKGVCVLSWGGRCDVWRSREFQKEEAACMEARKRARGHPAFVAIREVECDRGAIVRGF